MYPLSVTMSEAFSPASSATSSGDPLRTASLIPRFPNASSTSSKALQHEGVVPEVCLGVVVRQAEDDEEALSELVGPLCGVLEGVVVLGALR